MKNLLQYIHIIALGLMLLSACSEDEKFEKTIFDTTPPTLTGLDLWIMDSITSPYNIEVIYKWKDVETDLGRNLTPPFEDKADGFVKILKSIWIEPYINEAGLTFFNTLSPKQLLLIGSSAYNSNGTITLGSAEGGRKIVIYEINQLDKKDKVRLRRYMKTIHHEFGHIANQTIEIPVEYEMVTPDYRSDWNNVSEQVAYDAGFISPYAMSAPSEDFVEMLAIFLTNSKSEWEALLNKPTTDAGKIALKTKQDMVISYYKTIWNIDLYSLQSRCEAAINNVTNS